MYQRSLMVVIFACAALGSLNANATVLKTLNGVSYEWLELANTAGMSRAEVESQLKDASSPLYGYQYASRSLVKLLMQSYTPWNGKDGWHGTPTEVAGMAAYFKDFGALINSGPLGTRPRDTVNGHTLFYNNQLNSIAIYGTSAECGDATQTCYAELAISNYNGTPTMTFIAGDNGRNETQTPLLNLNTYHFAYGGSHLVKALPEPMSGAMWLLGSGVMAFVELARRKMCV